MMLTPAQAAATWCPMVRLPAQASAAAYNRVHATKHVPDTCRCIADKCAMWRWDTRLSEDDREALEAGTVSGVDLVKGWTPKGYCGLAGAPLIGGGAA